MQINFEADIEAQGEKAKPAKPHAEPPKTSKKRVKVSDQLETKEPAKRTSKEVPFTVPEDAAACADEIFRQRAKRLELQKQVDELAARESACREALMKMLPALEASGISGKVANARIEKKKVATVKDWSIESGLWGYLLRNMRNNPGLSGMLQRRINEAMVFEIMDSGKSVPGVESVEIQVLRINKL
jgi:hypothetical protein